MYQEAVEQAARGINIFEFAKFAKTCPGTEFGILQPNPELERLDAALAAMCQPEEDEFEDFPVIPRPDRIDDFNAITFIDEKMLEELFELYDGDRPLFDSDIYQVGSDYSPCAPRRSYHAGRIYGSGHYGNSEQEARYQCFIRDPDMVFEVLDEFNRQQANLRSESRRYKWDEPDVYPRDLLDPEPFIRAPVISYEAAVIMEEEFYEVRWDKQFQERRYIWDIREANELDGAGEEYEFER
jgi:hypothetical protein